jgi:hypothetical protein
MERWSGLATFQTLLSVLVVVFGVACFVPTAHELALQSQAQAPAFLSEPTPNQSATWPAARLPLILTPKSTGSSTSELTSDVELILSTSTALPGEPITVTVTNHSSEVIGTYDQKSLCSIFFVEEYDDEIWQSVLECPLVGRRLLEVAILPGRSESLRFNEGDPMEPDALSPGMYRVRFRYKRIKDIANLVEDLFYNEVPWQTAYSPILTVEDP